jgi:hypothetical protein
MQEHHQKHQPEYPPAQKKPVQSLPVGLRRIRKKEFEGAEEFVPCPVPFVVSPFITPFYPVQPFFAPAPFQPSPFQPTPYYYPFYDFPYGSPYGFWPVQGNFDVDDYLEEEHR